MASLYSRYNDRIEPPTPEKPLDSTIVGRCPICGQPICYGDKDIYVIDGIEIMIHENCMVFKEFSPSALLDLLGVDHYKVSAAKVCEEGY